MRSRYSAYCQGNVDYLIATHHPAQRHTTDPKRLAQSMAVTEWVYLTVVQVSQGKAKDKTGMVEFVAVYRQRQPPTQKPSILSLGSKTRSKTGAKTVENAQELELGQLHERSRFIKDQGRWFYLEGERLPPFIPKRNQPCWCGSGKKFKHCHGS
jgi:SEC-C motif-containing protein